MGKYADEISFESRVRFVYRRQLAEWLCTKPFNAGLTLNFNSDSGILVARRQIGELFARVDRKLLGTRFHRKRDLRTTGVFFFEHVESNLHAHGLIEVRPDRLDAFKTLFEESASETWADVCTSGTCWLDDLTNIRAAAYYDTKEQKPWSDPQTTLWLEEFFPATAG